MKKFSKRYLIFLLLVIGVVVAAAAYFLPYELHAEYQGKGTIYQQDIIEKEDFKVYATSRTGRIIAVEDYTLNSKIASQSGYVMITSRKPHLETLVKLSVIPVKSSSLQYNKKCYEDQTDQYEPNVKETILYEDGKEEVVEESDLDVRCLIDMDGLIIHMYVQGKNDYYHKVIPMITVESIACKNKVTTGKTIDPNNLDFTLRYSDGSSVKADHSKLTADTVEKAKQGINLLKCYYIGKRYMVEVKGFDDAGNPTTVTFPKFGTFVLQHSKAYNVEGVSRLNTSVGVRYFNNHRETFYTIHETGGASTSLYIPGRHIAEDGTVRDKDGFICVAANYKFCGRYEVVMTTLGPGKVYDTGCRYGTIDLYVDW